MGAREDLLAAVASLRGGGVEVFSPAQLLEEARRLGSTYPDATLRTFVVGPMCINSPDNHAVQYGDLERVGRGLYRLVANDSPTSEPRERPRRIAAADAPEAGSPTEADVPLAYDDEWFWEGNVQASVVGHLAAGGWRIRRVAGTASSEHGVDIEAERGAATVLVEVKGYPGTVYARGPRQGEPRSGSVGSQARAYFASAVLSGVLMRSARPDADIVLAFPEMATYTSLAVRTARPLAECGVAVRLVREDGAVRAVAARGQA